MSPHPKAEVALSVAGQGISTDKLSRLLRIKALLACGTNNGLVENFSANNLNELTTAGRSGTLTVAGSFDGSPTSVTVSGTGLSSGAANVYSDGTWDRAGATLANGANSYSVAATDSLGRNASDSVSLNLPVTNFFVYDSNGNLLTDGQRYFTYDHETQLTSITVPNSWRSEFAYDGLMRRRIRREYKWAAGSGFSSEFVTGVTTGTPRNDFSGWVGFQMNVGEANLTVTDLGRYIVSGNTGTHTVKIVNASGTDVSGASVSIATSGATAGQFKYVSLADR